jgi:hypothetical protein
MAAPVREDFLNEDPEIPGQKFCLLSFLSPEKVLAKKDVYMFSKFLETFEYTQRVTTFEKFLIDTMKGINDSITAEADKAEQNDLSGVAVTLRAARPRLDTLMDTFQAYVKGAQAELKESKVKEMYDDFMFKNRGKLEQQFYELNEFNTSVRGLKVRGTYNSKEEATIRSKKLQKLDTIHNIFIGEIGKWLPWDPEPSDIQDQEYAEDKLNTLMKKYKENEEARDEFERENRARGIEASKRAKVGVAGTEELAASASGTESMFSTDGPADLAIARKMENKNA